jgi:transposase
VIDEKAEKIICTTVGKGRRHDFYLFKNSKVSVKETVKILADSGYQGLKKLHAHSELPKKKTKKNPLTKEDKRKNHEISSKRVLVENMIRKVKVFKIMSEKYRNRRKRFTLRLNLICGIINYEL